MRSTRDSGSSAVLCDRCSARLPANAAVCSFCRASLARPSAVPPTARSIHDAAAAWARGVFGAPWQLDRLITAVDVRDQIFERLATEIVRRVVREVRAPSNERRASYPRLDPRSVDPYGVSVAELRAASEYIASCNQCTGAGRGPCNRCAGSKRAPCSSCEGSGKEVKHYERSSRVINCKACRGRGDVRCGSCDNRGQASCNVCLGSGYQHAWLTYEQQSRWSVRIEPNISELAMYPQLMEHRLLTVGDLASFRVLAEDAANGPVHRQGLSRTSLAETGGLAPEERVHRQQYIQFAAVHREVRFSMSGTTGTLVLSGTDLAPGRGSTALGPIRARLYAWAAMGVALAMATGVLMGALRGSGPYFEAIRSWITALWLLSLALAIPVLGAVLRSFQPGLRFRGLRPFEKVLGVAAAGAFGVFLLVGVIAQPRKGEVDRALSAGDVARARLVVDALKAAHPFANDDDVGEAEDAVLLAEAKSATGDARWEMLDQVSKRGGSRAADAAGSARTERLAEARRLIAEGTPAPAIAAMERWFPSLEKTDPEIAEALAAAHDHLGELCKDDVCRLQATRRANEVAATPARAERARAARDALFASFAPSEIAGESKLARLQRLREIAAGAARTPALAPGDEALVRRAKEAETWALSERAKVPVLGADRAIAEELFAAPATTDGNRVWIAREETIIYLALDATKTCRGLYVVGARAHSTHRAVSSAERILSQATGRASVMKGPPPGGGSASRWYESSTPVVARWRSGELIELRIGDAAP
ncbi:hypothetical protein [Pendulispora albinea]|uniref:Uncharacterized protein n=1 Tax=Pendulispora albinea TaxID=2741071 RepID=A0ABZ2M332_9BACT